VFPSAVGIGVGIVLLVVGVLPASAQGQRPYRGLFGGGAGSGGLGQSLTLNGTLSGGYSHSTRDEIGVAPGDPTSSNVQRGSRFERGSLGLNYSLSVPRVTVSSAFRTSGSWYAQRSRPLLAVHTLNASMTAQGWSGMSVRAAGSLAARPVYFLNVLGSQLPLGEQAIDLDEEIGIDPERVVSSTMNVGLTQRMTSHADFALSYVHGQSQSPSGLRDFSTNGTRAGVNVAVAKGLGVQLGYGRMTGVYGVNSSAPRFQNDTIDVGLNFNRALSLTRRMTMSFGTGLSGVKPEGANQHYRLIGHLDINRELGRTWTISAGYRRNVSMYYTFRQPVASDSLGTTLGGLINRRVNAYAEAVAGRGMVGFGMPSSTALGSRDYRAWIVATGLGFGLKRTLSLSLDYSYNHYSFGQAVQLPSALLQRLDRQSVRANINLWVPLLSRSRRLNASR
jgi:hypothetical protein